jgi:hypothetical protein
MAKKISPGDTVKIEGRVSKIWPDGRISVWLRSLDYPVTVREDAISDVSPGKKEPAARNRRKPIFNNPKREEGEG